MSEIIQTESQPNETKEKEPKIVVFKLLVHLKEGTIDGFLGDLKNDLKQENAYEQPSHERSSEGVSLNLKGGRSLAIMGKMSEEKGLSLVGMKWRKDIEKGKYGGLDKGIALSLEFGYGKTESEEWDSLAKKVFENYLWNVTYHEGGDKIGLFGPSEIVTRADGTRASDEPGRQFTLDGVKKTYGDDGLIFDWNGTKISMSY